MTSASASISRPRSFNRAILAATVATVLNDTGFAASLLELEVTENILLEDDKVALETFQRIQDLGVRIAFDDFGTGYASLTYLKKFPLDRLKIDKSFVQRNPRQLGRCGDRGLHDQPRQALGLSVIAEGIEDPATADVLKSMGCEEGQGYLFRRSDAGRRIRAALPAQRFAQRARNPASAKRHRGLTRLPLTDVRDQSEPDMAKTGCHFA